MKRSEINRYLREGEAFFRYHHFYLPPFAYWTPADWGRLGGSADFIRRHGLGWDVTDLASGKFEEIGLLLFTLRNGLVGDPEKIFAEKIMMVRNHQRTPLHFHFQKTEDIINRGGGELVLELYNSTPDGGLASTEVSVRCDGMLRNVAPGGKIVLRPGESITLTPGLYHTFYAERGHVLAGEVSSVNDDVKDNRFFDALPRFTAIEEDEEPLYPLCSDHRRDDK